ncbi:hypothetical protein FHETE_9642 [Fusarium heterosporum]|uniref:Uncharacterized protein n=1 Tax=Fusarium heterosporum TaxID=42747 RepID=A0A8H5WI89_FUSHE|nr:hypothetical protein FHETE_9642 [Fusarium heterosporum]
MSEITKEVNGVLVTNTDEIEPPSDWTNVYEDIGGDMQWGEDGDVAELANTYGIEGTVKPLFAMQSYTGEALSLFEINGSHYLYNAIEASLYQICQPDDLKTIVTMIDESGMNGLEIEAL